MTTNKDKLAINRPAPDSSIAAILSKLEGLETFVDYIANSETYNKNFKITKAEDGKEIKVVDRNAIANCIILGSEYGIPPMKAIMMGSRITQPHSIIKMDRGRSLGIDPINSLSVIYVWEKGGKETIYTSIHAVNKVLSDNGIIKEVIDDGTKDYGIYTYATSRDVIEFDPLRHVIVNTGIKGEDLKAALQSGKIPVKVTYTRRGLVKLTRTSNGETVQLPYTLIDAVEAELYHGTKEDGTEVDGKDNWNKFPAAHLIKMSIIQGARFIASDKLYNTYIAEELPIYSSTENDVEDGKAEVVQ